MATKEERDNVLLYILENKKTSLNRVATALDYEKEKVKEIVEYLYGNDLIICKSKRIDGNILLEPTFKATDFLSVGLSDTEKPEPTINIHGDMKISNYKVGGPSFKNSSDIHFGDKITIQKLTDNAKTYNIDRLDNSFIENASIKIINKYGEVKPKIYGIVSLLSGVISIITGITSSLTNKNGFISSLKWLAVFPQKWGIPLIVIGVCLAAGGGFLIRAVEYKYESRCPKCKRFYSIEEIEDPIVRDVEVKGGTRRTMRIKDGCKHEDCNYENVRTKNDFIENRQN